VRSQSARPDSGLYDRRLARHDGLGNRRRNRSLARFGGTGTGPNSLGGNIAEQQTRKPNYAQGLLATIADQTLPGRFLLAPDIPRRTGTRPAADDPTGRRIDLPAGPAMALRLHPNDPVKVGALIYHPEIPTEFGIPEALTTHFMPPTYPRGLNIRRR
jgi:hypothetical protein